MKYIFAILLISIMSLFAVAACSSKPICQNSSGGFRSVLDPDRNCSVRIRQVIVGSEIDLPKSLSFKNSDVQWTYRWIESEFKNGVLELGHFVLVPAGKGI
ncbi:MAG: hypothetical protein ACXVCY_07725 [Pseudobdellovibrionaceae bacterium]